MPIERRVFVAGSTVLGAELLLSACRASSEIDRARQPSAGDAAAAAPLPGAGDEGGKGEGRAEQEVTATEDLMREHGIIRRAIVVYRELAGRLVRKPDAIPPDALQKTARLFRSFGEDYHERKLEEEHIFPALKRAGGPGAAYVDVLTAQHQRGREITDYIIAVTQAAKIGANARPLANVLEGFARMYEAHTAREDTVVFPAWKETMSPKQLDEMGDRFEDIERATFGKDGFDDAVDQIASIEGSLGLADLAAFTAPPLRTPM
jgi:hemerythrin-like domain-containing protein